MSALPLPGHSRAGPALCLALPLALLCCGLLLPVCLLIVRGLTDADGNWAGLANFLAILGTPGLAGAVWHTLAMGAAVMAATTLLALLVSYGIAGTRMAGRRPAEALCLLPLFAPSLFPCVGLMYLLGPQGLAPWLLCGAELQGPAGVFLGSLVYCLPHAVLLCSASLRSIEPSLYEAARTLGAGPWRQFATVTLPHMRYGLASAALVSFTLTITDFGIPKMLGGDFSMLATEIYKQVLGMQNFSLGASISLVLMLPAAAAFLADGWARKKQSRLFGRGHGRPPDKRPCRDRVFSLVVWAVLAAQAGLFALVVWASLISFWPYDLSLTLIHYDFSALGGSFAPFGNSLALAGSAALLGPALMFAGAYCVTRCPVPAAMAGLYRLLSLLPLSIPGTVLGLAYIFAFNRPGVFFDLLHGSMPLLVLNTVVHFYTVGHLTFSAWLQSVNPDYESVGFAAGAPRRVTFFRVIMPLGAKTALNVSLYLFVNALTTISAVVFLYSPKSLPASVFMLQISDTGNTAAAAAAGTGILALALGARLLYSLLFRRAERNRSA